MLTKRKYKNNQFFQTMKQKKIKDDKNVEMIKINKFRFRQLQNSNNKNKKTGRKNKNDSKEVSKEKRRRAQLVTKLKEIRVWGTTVWRAPLSVKPAR